MVTNLETFLPRPQNTTFFLFLIIILGISIRFFYFPFEVPIVTDGYFSFIYSASTVFAGELPIGYTVGNTGWANFLSLIFSFMEKTDPMYLMDVQRTSSIFLSTLTIIPAYFIFKKFTNYKLAIFGCLLLAIEPRLLLISLEGINYSLFLFLFVTSLALFLKKTNFSLIACFVCISFAVLVRYEAIFLILPFSIMYFRKFGNKNGILRYLVIIFTIAIILIPIGMMRMEATQNICYQHFILGETCGKDGIISEIIGNISFFTKYIIFDEKLDEYVKDDETYRIHFETYDDSSESVFSKSILVGSSKLATFFGLILLPYFLFFIVANIITRIKNRESLKWNFDSTTVFLCTIVMLLPAMYGFMRDINEIRYVLIFIPLVCIISISFRSSVVEKISQDKRILIMLIIFTIILSIAFIEYEKRDYIYDRESFKISKEIVSYTDKTNAFDNAGYIKTAILFNEWPDLPKPNVNGKIDHLFEKISTKNFVDIQEFIIFAKKSNLEYFVVDEKEVLFEELRVKIEKYPYLEKTFDSDYHDYENRFLIFKIDYEKFDKILNE